MQLLLAVIMTWLALNFGLPLTDEHPRVEFATEAEMAQVRSSRLGSDPSHHLAAVGEGTAQPEVGHGAHAIYDGRTQTIYLPEGWTASSPAHVSLLVHEMVHHLQNAGGLKYDCPEAREKPAYQAQARWLELFGTNLTDAFEIDAMTILLRSNCFR